MIGKGETSIASPNVNILPSTTTPSFVQPIVISEPLAIQLPQNQSNPNFNPNANAPPKISANFDRPTNTKKSQKPHATNNHPPIQPVKQAPPITNHNSQSSNPSNQNKPASISPPPPLLLSIPMSQDSEPYMRLTSNL